MSVEINAQNGSQLVGLDVLEADNIDVRQLRPAIAVASARVDTGRDLDAHASRRRVSEFGAAVLGERGADATANVGAKGFPDRREIVIELSLDDVDVLDAEGDAGL